MEKIVHSLLILDNEKYNEIHEKYNLNAIKAKMHNQAYINLLHKGCDIPKACYVDEFAPKELYFSYLADDREVYHDLVFETKAESRYPAVACASVIARYAFLNRMEAMNRRYGMTFHLGAGDEVNSDIRLFVSRHGNEKLKEVGKIHFRNTDI